MAGGWTDRQMVWIRPSASGKGPYHRPWADLLLFRKAPVRSHG